jgi:hypothetical protein
MFLKSIKPSSYIKMFWILIAGLTYSVISAYMLLTPLQSFVSGVTAIVLTFSAEIIFTLSDKLQTNLENMNENKENKNKE